ncbi:hypothetical protein KIN20_020669 [Parelaphostrongylus tenuis]|uniref:Uncharacterized protein n=1 Tax=Parelaphostrongylus tenuis TaxID=148309 RepID=A0AAD5QR07_PARTN|nr:hypothetical protein KIN20_020669 [Parelaphostrongylus tenuis]
MRWLSDVAQLSDKPIESCWNCYMARILYVKRIIGSLHDTLDIMTQLHEDYREAANRTHCEKYVEINNLMKILGHQKIITLDCFLPP